MATEVIDIKIKTAESATSIAELRKGLKGLINELQNVPAGSKEFQKLSKAINDTEGKIGDLTDSFNTLKGSGVERTTSSIGLLREGFQNFDTEKIKIGLNGIGAAFKAIPIFLVIEGVKYLVENFSELSKGSGILAKALRAIGDLLSSIKEGLMIISDTLLDTTFQFEEASKKMIESIGKATEANTYFYESQIKLAAAAGKSTVEWENKKQQAIRESAFQQIVILENIRKKTGELSEDQEKQLEDLKRVYNTANTELKAIQLKDQADKEKKDNEAAEKRKAIKDKELAEDIKREQDRQAREADVMNAQIDKEEKEAKRHKEQLVKDATEAETAKQNAINRLLAESDKKDEERRKKAEADTKASEDAKLQAVSVGLEAARGLSEAVFAFQLRAAEGNAKKEMEIRKRMFQVDKAFNVARAVQDGIRSVQAALTIPPPGGQILAGVNAALAAANVAKILATKFDPGNSGGGSNQIEAPSTQTPTIPQLNTNAPTTQPTTQFDSTGRNISIVAKVYEGEMTSAQRRTQKLEEQSTI